MKYDIGTAADLRDTPRQMQQYDMATRGDLREVRPPGSTEGFRPTATDPNLAQSLEQM